MSEFLNLAELENLSLDLDALRIQSLIICERILGKARADEEKVLYPCCTA